MNRLSRVKLRHLEIFVEIARLKSVSKAATYLNLTQPAVTRTLRELEEIAGKPLVEKDGRGIRLSHYGNLFLRYAGTSLAAARNGIEALSKLSLADGPPVRIGALPTVSATIAPRAVYRFLQTGIRNRPKIVTGENQVLLSQLRGGELDLVIGRLPPSDIMQGLVFEPLYRDKVVFVVAAHHPLANAADVPLQQLDAYPVLLPPAGSIIRPIVDQLFVERGITDPAQIVETVSDSFGRAFVRAYQAIWIISRGVVQAELDSGDFATLAIDTHSTLGSVGLISRATDVLPAATQQFASIVRETVRAFPD